MTISFNNGTTCSWDRIWAALETIKAPWKEDVIPFAGDLLAVQIIIDKGYDKELGYSIDFNSDFSKIRKIKLKGFGKMSEGNWIEAKIF